MIHPMMFIRKSVETGSSKSDTNKQDPSSDSTTIRRHNELKSSSVNNGLEVPIDLQSTQVKTTVSIPVSSETNVILPNDKDDEYEKLYKRMNSLSVVIDNNSCQNATVIQINGINRQEVLLEVVQVLTNIDCIFTKASITSDGSWSMMV
ncbi:uncharacterized protein LOC143567275 [Bidens hawaiensis]|uniref:uncharacterized protein LOC143567275 n=1 Tax=Bidens hawaiensis TaxID=980011 RepID=UPI00404B4D31